MAAEVQIKIEKKADDEMENSGLENYIAGENFGEASAIISLCYFRVKYEQNDDEKCDLLADTAKNMVEVKLETDMDVEKIEHIGAINMDVSSDSMHDSSAKDELWAQDQQIALAMDHNGVSYNQDFYEYHSHFLAAVSNDQYECPNCTYKTTSKSELDVHMLKHSEIVGSDRSLTCIHCNASYKSKQMLDDHVVRKHPEFIATVSSKIHECPCCGYQTTIKTLFGKHVMKHPEAADSFNFSACMHCSSTFKTKIALDEHIIKKHPDFIESVSSKILECADCTFKTVMESHLDAHMTKHIDRIGKYKVCICTHCNATFKSNQMLGDHIIRKHPDFIDTVSSKVHQCVICDFKTTMKGQLATHMLKHPETADCFTYSSCTHCNATFKSKAVLDEHIVRNHPDLIPSVTRKMHECTNCSYKTTMTSHLIKHMLKHPETADSYKVNTCVHCSATFDGKQVLDDHIIKKHPEFAATVSRKIYDCPKCTYKSTIRARLAKHMLQHPETGSSFKLSTCIHCNATFKSKTSLDEHTIRKHPGFMDSISSKIHECANCTYKTTMTSQLARHMLKHPNSASGFKLNTCTHCNKTFESKQTLDDHIIKRHPDFLESVSGKIYECTNCEYKTTIKSRLAKHMLNHPEATGSYKLSICTHCNTTFKSKQTLDDHVIKKHPDHITSISSKIHECPKCPYKSTSKSLFDKHILKHPEINGVLNTSCQHCDARFHSKTALDDHTIKKHPRFDASVTSKVHTCPTCGYRTTMKSNLNKHMSSKHP
nr:unnamed protein product [Callosobruchus analis]